MELGRKGGRKAVLPNWLTGALASLLSDMVLCYLQSTDDCYKMFLMILF